MDPDTISKLANLPWNLQIVLGSGYLSYMLAYYGLRHGHKTMDAVSITIVFGLIALVALTSVPSVIWPVRIAIAVSASLVSAIAWRSFGRTALRELLRFLHYSWADDTNSAWEHLLEYNASEPMQLTVETNDGWQFFCTDTSKLKGLALTPFVLGTSGDVLMYADHTQSPESEEASPKLDTFNDQYGSNITYLPASQIKRVVVRYLPISSKAEAGNSVVKAARSALSKLRRRRQSELAGE